MKIGVISLKGQPTLAAIYGDVWVSLPKALQSMGKRSVNELSDFITQYGDEVPALNQEVEALVNSGEAASYTYPIAEAEFLAPLPAYPKLFTARGNSACFTRVIRSAVCKEPVMEMRYHFNIVGHNSVQTFGKGYLRGGWNYEMICVMGKPCHGVKKEDAYNYVFGYTNMLDHSGTYQDFPFDQGNKWSMPENEKIFADYGYQGCYNGNVQVSLPIGPYIVTKDEVGDPHAQMIEERENGRLVSYGSASAVCFTFDEMIAYTSTFMTLQPGDMMSSASITYDGFPVWDETYPPNGYIQGGTEKLGALRLNIKDERKGLA